MNQSQFEVGDVVEVRDPINLSIWGMQGVVIFVWTLGYEVKVTINDVDQSFFTLGQHLIKCDDTDPAKDYDRAMKVLG